MESSFPAAVKMPPHPIHGIKHNVETNDDVIIADTGVRLPVARNLGFPGRRICPDWARLAGSGTERSNPTDRGIAKVLD